TRCRLGRRPCLPLGRLRPEPETGSLPGHAGAYTDRDSGLAVPAVRRACRAPRSCLTPPLIFGRPAGSWIGGARLQMLSGPASGISALVECKPLTLSPGLM